MAPTSPLRRLCGTAKQKGPGNTVPGALVWTGSAYFASPTLKSSTSKISSEPGGILP